MKSMRGILRNFFFTNLCFCIISFIPFEKVYAQEGSYSTEAQNILDTYSTADLDVFKFSINNILNSDGDIVEKPAGNPSIFGRTDYGSEFFLENELSTAFSIEIPAFVINDLALDSSGEYFPIIIDGTDELSIDFKDLYDTKSGEAITPEMGFVKIIDDATSSDLENLSDGEIVEFFVRPTDKYSTQHNKDNLFFIDRPIPENPVVSETVTGKTKYSTTDSSSSADEKTIHVEPGEKAITLPSGEVKIYVTSVYVPAPASKFEPTQIVMPVLADGDYNYNEEPAAAETFSDDLQVVAIPEEEAKAIAEKVREVKVAKEKSQKYKRELEIPAIDAELEPLIALLELDIENRKSSSKLLLDAKKNILKNFPNISNQLVDLVINLANPDKKFELMQNPKKFMDKEFVKLNDPTEFNLLLGGNLPQKDLIKIYNLILYKFSSDLADLGFETRRNQKIDFSDNITNIDQILELVQLQQDIFAIVSLFGPYKGIKDVSILIDPVKTNPDSSTNLFEASSSQKVLDRMKQFSEVINTINSPFYSISTISGDNIPTVEIKVQLGENIADALQKKLNKDKRLNRNFQTRSQNSKLDKFDFEIPTQDESLDKTASPTLLADAPNISDQELQLVAETTEATNKIINETITRMLKELGDNPSDESYFLPVLATNNVDAPNQENQGIREDYVFGNALSSAQRLREIEDIRAVFQILGIGS